MRALLAVVLGAAFAAAAADAAYWQQQAEGWFWYAALERAPAAAPPPEPRPAAAEPAEVFAHKQLQRRLEQTRSVAIMNPTEHNVIAYLTAQQEVMRRSARFADVWQRVVWSAPQFDYSVTHRPTNAVALHGWERQRSAQRAELVAAAAEDHGLFFVFGPDCAHCAQMGAGLRRMSERFGFTVQAVAVDGAAQPDFPDAWADNGFAAAAQLSHLPAIVLARLAPGNEQLTVLASGPLTDAELLERIAVLTGIEVGERF